MPLLRWLSPPAEPTTPRLLDEEGLHAVGELDAATRVLAIARRLRQGTPYRSLRITEEALGALIREALDDQDALRDRAALAISAAAASQTAAEAGVRLIEELRTTPTPEHLWMEVRVSEEGQRARKFARLYGQASQTIGRLRAEKALLREEVADRDLFGRVILRVAQLAEDIERVVAVEDEVRGDPAGADRPQHARALIEVGERIRTALGHRPVEQGGEVPS